MINKLVKGKNAVFLFKYGVQIPTYDPVIVPPPPTLPWYEYLSDGNKKDGENIKCKIGGWTIRVFCKKVENIESLDLSTIDPEVFEPQCAFISGFPAHELNAPSYQFTEQEYLNILKNGSVGKHLADNVFADQNAFEEHIYTCMSSTEGWSTLLEQIEDIYFQEENNS